MGVRSRIRMAKPRIATADTRCVKPPPKQAEPFYLSPEWRHLMDQIIVERFGSRENARCEDPQCKWPHRRGIRIFGDHIKELKDGGALLDKHNVLCRCGSCHTRKTNEERAKRAQRGPDVH